MSSWNTSDNNSNNREEMKQPDFESQLVRARQMSFLQQEIERLHRTNPQGLATQQHDLGFHFGFGSQVNAARRPSALQHALMTAEANARSSLSLQQHQFAVPQAIARDSLHGFSPYLSSPGAHASFVGGNNLNRDIEFLLQRANQSDLLRRTLMATGISSAADIRPSSLGGDQNQWSQPAGLGSPSLSLNDQWVQNHLANLPALEGNIPAQSHDDPRISGLERTSSPAPTDLAKTDSQQARSEEDGKDEESDASDCEEDALDDEAFYKKRESVETVEDLHLQHETFPLTLYRMLFEVEKAGNSHIVSFLPHGKSFSIHNQEKFAEILPNYFATDRMASFQRQLNLYGFRRVSGGNDKGAFYHDKFIRGKRCLCKKIKRNTFSRKIRSKESRRPPPSSTQAPVLGMLPGSATGLSIGAEASASAGGARLGPELALPLSNQVQQLWRGVPEQEFLKLIGAAKRDSPKN